ncbi:HTH-type transcriptional regulator MalT [Paraburkholderia ultramafica]|uniref:HTH-type transcriptional regulator MalT n=1 Tax=Paraburkholderia ultramafica TaxID=1544867 RepID=A0A6S7BJG5_9BURK|nr:LuxR C-terminal-related transcriptional regulator [Paraburkholderia ultramafica]CAB3801119.1 HTH-type transcriptional regulator MalT [Paraburkholderia ultramafica]
MASTIHGADGAATELILKTIAPRATQHLLVRARLSADEARLRNLQVALVQAPAGYGKTSLLTQWRREHLARGVAVAWLSVDERDDARRLLLGLVHAVRAGCARPTFGRLVLSGAAASSRELEGITAWLAEVAQLSINVVLIVDEADRLPAGGSAALSYLLHNAPQNLRVAVSARRGLDDAAGDLLAYGAGELIGPELLRFRLDEAIALISERFGARVDADVSAQLFELSDGWPLGFQLALAAMARADDPREAAQALSADRGGLRHHLVGALIAKLSAEDNAFLTRISVVDRLHPQLCVALTGDDEALERLARLVRDTPVFIASEDSAWCRLHVLVRDVLRGRLADLPEAERAALHSRASAWLAAQGMLGEAARHAHAAGQHQAAYDLAERCLHDAVKEGNLAAVLDWLELLPEAELERRPRLRLAAAWVLALGERHPEAERQVEHVLADPAAGTELRYECAMILSAAAYYADNTDRFVTLLEPWLDTVPSATSWLAQIHANRRSALAILQGEPAQARRYQQLAPRRESATGLGYVKRWGDHTIGLSYLLEGQPSLAEAVLMPALASAEADLGRRHPLTCMFAAMCAAVCYETDRVEQAAALLANRLDVLERGGTPEMVTLAYRTAAQIAAVQGVEHRALDLLEALHAMGVGRRLPRLCIVSLAEQVRLHAGRYRTQTCEALVQRIDEIVAHEAARHGPLWLRPVAMLQALSHAYASVAARRWPESLDALAVALEQANAMKLGRYRIEIMVLQAFALEQTGAQGRPLLLEAMNLAHAYGLTRTLADAHPGSADWMRRVGEEAADAGQPIHAMPAPRVVPIPARPASGAPRAVPSVVLTPKEREILELLARNLSNKEIALAMSVGEETVKWHLKNLFDKLDASSRKHAVRRALVLGLLEAAQ